MSIIFKASWRKYLLIFFAFLSTGCAKPTDRGHVAKGWALAMRELQIVPVFPPREDMQVGDVYIVPARPEDEDDLFEEAGYLPRGLWIHTVNLNAIMSKFYEQRSNYPTTAADAMSISRSAAEGFSIRNSEYKWTRSKIPTQYYCHPHAQSGPKLRQPRSVHLRGAEISPGSPGSPGGLKHGEWGWGDHDELGYSTVYVRLPDNGNPDPNDLVENHLTYFVRGHMVKTEGMDVFTNGDRSRLRLVGFPSFMSATFTQGDLSSFFPVEAGSISGTASFMKSDSVTVKVPVAESCALPANLVIRALRKECGDGDKGEASFKGLDDDAKPFNPLGDITDFVPQNLRFVVKGEKTSEFTAVRVTVITEVFYARVVDVSMQAQESQGGALDWLTGQKPDGAPPEEQEDGKFEKAANLPAGTIDPNKTNTAEESAAAMQARLDSAKLDTPGVSMRVVSVSQSSISMRRIYDKPVAIGFRGFDVDVLFNKDGVYEGLQPVGVTQGSLPRDSSLDVAPKNGDDEETKPPKRNLFGDDKESKPPKKNLFGDTKDN